MQSAQRDNKRSTSRPRGGRNAAGSKPERSPRQNNEKPQQPQDGQPQRQERRPNNDRLRRPRLNNIHLNRDIKDIKLNDEQTALVRELDQKIADIGEVVIPPSEEIEKLREEYEKKISTLRGRIESHYIQLDEVQKRQEAFEAKANPHKKEFDETDAKIKEIDAELNPLNAKLNEIRAAKNELFGRKKDLKDKIPGRSLDDIDDQIDQLEYEIETQTLSNTHLKSKLAKIESLKKARGQFSGFATIDQQIDKYKGTEDELYQRRKVLTEAKNKLWAARKQFFGENKENKDQRNKFYEERKGIYDNLTKARNELKEQINSRKKAVDEFWARKNKALDKRTERSKLMNRRLQIYKEAEDRMELIEIRAQKAGTIHEVKNPNEEKINAARSLISFLQAVIALDDVAKEEDQTVVLGKATKSAALSLINSVKKQSKKEKLAAKNSKKAEESKKEAKLELSLQAIQQFTLTGVTQPTTIEQIPDVINQLKAKDQEWSDAFIKLVLNFDINEDGSVKSTIKFA
ncbi:hypothetical protein TVAG_333110 [Trichomonas vaginalis G3]|uniref:Uncharacterized protein n=1 Tax=Trichomonas vaginalis (strain ATCC PRA-98 / G3) TaxID=412133 RepID=A2EHA7_TRIV3|nr:nuclear segregation protein BFR1 family [Trichomonas vaginalis G3]EAY07986.1 hypothetical protein TVAG_333110 [Trichomonas vaginalis G3]KAI5486032.1 nuclear segregation protein BFR1 family [Trichomonas vaginalis G3]|eukprot:XP_001320209.1 hypothetical protein [Trichomonas vaginalis G3]